jgi:AraC family transcriptional regulator
MTPRIETLKEKKLIGMARSMSFSNNQTVELWQRFMPRRREIKHMVGIELYSAEKYKPGFFDHFNPAAEFEKWAAVEVSDFDKVPEGMQTFIFPEGLYAVFTYHGTAAHAVQFYTKIFMEWMPLSGFVTDYRPHFAVMGEKYKKDSEDSEEEIWIPIKPK